MPDGLPESIERLSKALAYLNDQIVKADQELLALAESDPVCKRLSCVGRPRRRCAQDEMGWLKKVELPFGERMLTWVCAALLTLIPTWVLVLRARPETRAMGRPLRR